MHLQFVLILNPVFCFLGASGTDFIWNNETRLGQYQRAWNMSILARRPEATAGRYVRRWLRKWYILTNIIFSAAVTQLLGGFLCLIFLSYCFNSKT
ncbi:hypothetical protein V5799_020924 [Amblyomma americanum]|uniref:Uncharacterized protein n=1 Tax=Amblyomma americanum TaxID=6943 RepID=A0AAQ4ETB5_AMBAM